MRRFAVVLLTITLSPLASAEIYQCVIDGRTGYQDYPCNGTPDYTAPARSSAPKTKVRNYKMELESRYRDLSAYEKQAQLCNNYSYYRNHREAYMECNKATNMGNTLAGTYALADSIMRQPTGHSTEAQWSASVVVKRFDKARDLIQKGLRQLQKR